MAGYFSGSRGKRRNLDAGVNLVPFIDLFSAIILFLISTAVWDELAAVNVNLAAQDKATLEAPKEDLRKVQSNVYITVGTDNIELFDEGKKTKIAKQNDAYDWTNIDKFVADMRAKYAEKKDMLVYATDGAAYQDLIGVMDRCLGQKFEDLIVTGQDQKM